MELMLKFLYSAKNELKVTENFTHFAHNFPVLFRHGMYVCIKQLPFLNNVATATTVQAKVLKYKNTIIS